MAGKILLVDDDEGYLLAARTLLEQEDYEVVTARGAREAREKLRETDPDLILLDVLMPGEDGFHFADELDASGDFSDIPVILVTAVAENPGQILHAFEEDKGCTAVDIVAKSDANARLAEIVGSALARRQAAGEGSV